jgi:hypothetical protein
MAEIRGIGKFNVKIDGLNELQAQFERIGKMPKKHLTKAAKLGSDDPLKQARANAPVGKNTKTRGLLKKGLQRKMETPNKRNKSVYRIRWNPKYTGDYLKETTGVYGGKVPYAYYPHSVEYGFKTKKGRTEGKYFVAKAINATTRESLQKIVDSLNDSIDTLTR